MSANDSVSAINPEQEMTDLISPSAFSSPASDLKSRKRIAITGVGLVTPLGLTRESSWQGLLAGRSAVNWLTSEPFSQYPPIERAGEPASEWYGARAPWEEDLNATGRMVAFALRAATEAVKQAGLSRSQLEDSACLVGTSKIDLQAIDDWQQSRRSSDLEGANANLFFPSCAATEIAREFGCAAGIQCPVAACATGLVSLIQAAELIRSSHCPVVIAGSTDASLHPGLLSSYRRLGVLAKPGLSPMEACRPFDEHRNGFAVGEGAGILVLEDWDHAQARGALILAEWIGGTIASDPTALTRIDNTGSALADVIQRTLQRHHISADEIGAISVHGTATRLNDEAEAAGLREVFGKREERSPNINLPAFGIKGAVGHLMGAAGAVETAACVLALTENRIPPTVNHTTPMHHLAFKMSATDSQPLAFPGMLKVSLGFGGTLAVAILKGV